MIQNQAKKIDYLSHKILPVMLMITEYFSILAAEKISLYIQHSVPFANGVFYIPDTYFYGIIPMIYIFFMRYTKANERFILFWETMQRTFYAVFYSSIFCVIVLYLFKSSNYVSRLYIVVFFIMSFVCIYLGRQILVKTCNRLDIMKEPVLFAGGGKVIEDIIYFAGHNNCFGIKVIGIVTDSEEGSESIASLSKKYPVYYRTDKIKKYIQALKIRTVIIAEPTMEKMKLLHLVEYIQPLVRNVMFVPDTAGVPIYNLETKKLYESNILLLSVKNNLLKTRNYVLKRIFDMILSVIGMIVVLPVSAVICALILIESPGAMPIFKHYRVGRMGKIFPCYKFRSMVPHAQEKLKDYLAANPEARKEWNQFYKLKNDPRITKVGRILRKTSLDELPQVLNVLKGEMSLVGPRPIIKDELRYYGKNVRDYYSVLPGITGMWQANGRSDTGYKERVELDVWYVRNWSIWIDIAIICKTIKAVFCGKGAY